MIDPLSVCEQSVLRSLVSGLWQTCSCGNNSWDTSSYKQENFMFHENYIVLSTVYSSL